MAVMMNAEEMNLPGLTFYPEFVTIEEEEVLFSLRLCFVNSLIDLSTIGFTLIC